MSYKHPKVTDLKTEIGHWESDIVIGKGHEGIVVTHVDKASKYLLAGLAKNKTMEEINRVTLKLFLSNNYGLQRHIFQRSLSFLKHCQDSV